ncbi:MAG: hypothetical protein EB168_10275 [Euryarchaeota archaeon]|nr:hypothetical protein [Euryarchaeota archaeon]
MSMIMVGAMMGMFMIPIANMATTTAKSRSVLQARILYESEIDRLRRLWSIDQQNFDAIMPHNDKCEFNRDVDLNSGFESHGYTTDGEGFNAHVTCYFGTEYAGGEDVVLAYPASDKNPGQYQDLNLDGFEDTTGLPTHYDQCYAGWKGDGFKYTSCDIGTTYVIPMYQPMYNAMDPADLANARAK